MDTDYQILFAEYVHPLPHAAALEGEIVLRPPAENDPESLNDLRFLIVGSDNSKLTEAQIRLSEDATLVSIEGKGVCFSIVVRPPVPPEDDNKFESELTISVVEAETPFSKTQVASFKTQVALPIAAWQHVLRLPETYTDIVTINTKGVQVLKDNTLDTFGFSGKKKESITLSEANINLATPYVPEKYLCLERSQHKLYLMNATGGFDWHSEDEFFRIDDDIKSLVAMAIDTHGRLIVASKQKPVKIASLDMATLHRKIQAGQDLRDVSFDAFTLENENVEVAEKAELDGSIRIAWGIERLFIIPNASHECIFSYLDSTLQPTETIVLPDTETTTDIFIYDGHLYRLNASNVLSKVDLSTVRGPQPREIIYPMFVSAGERVDLWKLGKYFNDVVWAVGYEKAGFVTIEENRYLLIDENATPESTAYLRLLGLNQNGITEKDALNFYVYVKAPTLPNWKQVDRLQVNINQPVNLFNYVENAQAIDFQFGFEVPTGVTLQNGQLLATQALDAQICVRAKLDGRFADTAFQLTARTPQTFQVGNRTKYQVFIEDVDVSFDLQLFPVIDERIDDLKLNAYIKGNCDIRLRSARGKYNPLLAETFWEENGLNPSGYLNSLRVYHVNPTGEQQLKFNGVVLDFEESVTDVEARITAYDVTYLFQQKQIKGIGLQKIVELAQEERDSHEGIYTPEQALTPLDLDPTAKASADTEHLTLKETTNRVEGVSVDKTAFLEASSLKTQGGTLESPVLLKSKTQARLQPLKRAIAALSTSERDLNVSLDVDEPKTERHIRSQGNIAFQISAGRTQHTITDWIGDEAKNRQLLLLRSETAPDEFWQYDSETQVFSHLHTFSSASKTRQIASTDFDTFYFLLDEGIKTFTCSTHYTETLVTADSDCPVQPNIFYPIAADTSELQSKGIRGFNKAGFEVSGDSLYYRFATDRQFGVARVDLTSKETEKVLSAEVDDYRNSLNFAFTRDGDSIIFAYSQGTPHQSEIIIKEKTGKSVRTLLHKTALIQNLTDLDKNGGAWLGVHEILKIGGNLYFSAPIARKNRDINKDAGMGLYRYGLDNMQLQLLKAWEFVQFGATALTEHQGTPYFCECPPEFYTFEPTNPDLSDNKIAEMKSQVKGNLRCIDISGDIQDLGNLYFEGEPYRALGTRCLSLGEELHLTAASGNRDTLLEKDAPVSHWNNMQWLVWSDRLRYFVDIPTSGSLYEALREIAESVNATLQVSQHQIRIRNRQPIAALTTRTTAINAVSNLFFDNATRAFPNSGYIKVNDEIIAYAGVTENALTGLSRAQAATTAQTHPDNSEILFLDSIESFRLKDDIQIEPQWTHLFNLIIDNQKRIRIGDANSQATFTEKTLTLNLKLTQHDILWMQTIARQYLSRFSEARQLLKFTTSVSVQFGVSDVVWFNYRNALRRPIQILRKREHPDRTELVGVEVAPNITPEADEIVVNGSFKTTDGAGNTLLVDGAGDTAMFAGSRLAFLPIEVSFGGATIPAQTWQQFQEIEPFTLPAVVMDGVGGIVYSLDAPRGIRFDTFTREVTGTPQYSENAMCVYTATDTEGNSDSLNFTPTLTASPIANHRVTDGAGKPLLIDGAGNVARFGRN